MPLSVTGRASVLVLWTTGVDVGSLLTSQHHSLTCLVLLPCKPPCRVVSDHLITPEISPVGPSCTKLQLGFVCARHGPRVWERLISREPPIARGCQHGPLKLRLPRRVTRGRKANKQQMGLPTYHPLSAPWLRKLQSLLSSQVQSPKPVRAVDCQSGTKGRVGRRSIPGAVAAESEPSLAPFRR